ncbi:carboxylating nicotinate-nucleotide diphosphorylase [bacterium]|nr:carboxylating nicotinate-nucleotide diphosphorylase [bacterium]
MTDHLDIFPSLEFTPEIAERIRQAIAEDVGSGDVTSEATIPADQPGQGRIFSRTRGVLCGVQVARKVMSLVDPDVKFEGLSRDGQDLEPGQNIARLSGPVRSILTAERLMLNFLQHLSGVASLTRKHVKALREMGSSIDVADTRKTTPGWRLFEKYAVVAGGGVNHRFALYDMYLIKNNHVDAAGGVGPALERVHAHNRGQDLKVSIEARDMKELEEILRHGADLVLLDNMDRETLRRAALRVRHHNRDAGSRILTEITGGVTLDNLAQYADIPADRVSIGALTHSVAALDIALHVK